MKHIILKISGFVQGVGFRYFAESTARKYNIKGYAKNLDDGDLLIEAEGEDENIKMFVERCSRGPMFAKVQNIDVNELKYENKFEGFDIVWF